MITSSSVNEADVAGRISGYFGVAATDSRVGELLKWVLPDVKQASARDPSSWTSAFPSVMAKYESIARDLGLGVSPRQRDIDTVRHANATDANFAGALGRLGWKGLRYHALLGGTAGEGGGRLAGNGSEHTSSTIYGRELPLGATGTTNFAKELGIGPDHAHFFMGTSHEMRDALREAIKNGRAITDDQVKNAHDVSAVIGAIRAGKLKPDDPRVPPSVRQIMEDMKNKGIDPATADEKTLKGYFKDHPDALKAAKRQDAQDVKDAEGLTGDQKRSKIEDAKPKTTAPPKGKPTAKPAVPTASL